MLAPPGWSGLEGPYAAGAPDLMTFGKVMGGGFPAAAFGGRADVMAMLAPDGPVYQAGTLSGNPVATAAGLATLRACTAEVYDRLGVGADAIDRGAATEALGRGRRARTSIQRAGQHVLASSSATARCATTTTPGDQDTAGVRRVLPRDARARASTCRRARSRRGSSPRPTTTRAVERVLDALPGGGAAAAQAFATIEA